MKKYGFALLLLVCFSLMLFCAAQADIIIPLGPHLHLEMVFQRHEKRVIIEPERIFRAEFVILHELLFAGSFIEFIRSALEYELFQHEKLLIVGIAALSVQHLKIRVGR